MPAYADNDFKLTMRLGHVFGLTEQLAISIQEAADNIREKDQWRDRHSGFPQQPAPDL